MPINFSEETEEIAACNGFLEEKSFPSEEEYKKVLYEEPSLRYFFEISLPATIAKGKPLGHILFVCPDKLTTEYFISLLLKKKTEANSRFITLSPTIAASDLTGFLTGICEEDILITQVDSLNLTQECLDLFKSAITSFAIDIFLGKGASAKSIRLDLPSFTFVACVEQSSHTVSALLPCFEYVIKVQKVNMSRLCISKIKAETPVEISDEACELIASTANNDVRTSVWYLERVFEYLQLQPTQNAITKSFVEKVFDLAGIGVKIEEPIDEEEIITLFREIRDSLQAIQKDISTIHNELNLLRK